jgi:hypothetical protein
MFHCVVLVTTLHDSWCTRVENMVEKNRSRLSIAVLLTTLICTRWTTTNFVFGFTSWSFRNLGAFNIPLERSWKYLSNGVLHALEIFKIAVVKPKKKYLQSFSDCGSGWSKEPQWIVKRLRFFSTMFPTSEDSFPTWHGVTFHVPDDRLISLFAIYESIHEHQLLLTKSQVNHIHSNPKRISVRLLVPWGQSVAVSRV